MKKKDAKLKMILKAESGYESTTDALINSDQWALINRIIAADDALIETVKQALELK